MKLIIRQWWRQLGINDETVFRQNREGRNFTRRTSQVDQAPFLSLQLFVGIAINKGILSVIVRRNILSKRESGKLHLIFKHTMPYKSARVHIIMKTTTVMILLKLLCVMYVMNFLRQVKMLFGFSTPTPRIISPTTRHTCTIIILLGDNVMKEAIGKGKSTSYL
jgi:hypothetical protein